MTCARHKQYRALFTAFLDETAPCRSEHAREKPEGATGIQTARVIVNVLREHARSYRRGMDA
jgi:hypothetical protein